MLKLIAATAIAALMLTSAARAEPTCLAGWTKEDCAKAGLTANRELGAVGGTPSGFRMTESKGTPYAPGCRLFATRSIEGATVSRWACPKPATGNGVTVIGNGRI